MAHADPDHAREVAEQRARQLVAARCDRVGVVIGRGVGRAAHALLERDQLAAGIAALDEGIGVDGEHLRIARGVDEQRLQCSDVRIRVTCAHQARSSVLRTRGEARPRLTNRRVSAARESQSRIA